MARSKTKLVRIRVTDTRCPEKTRCHAQRPIQDAAGFQALAGFTDVHARRGSWHTFRIAATRLPAFEREIRNLVRSRRVDVQIAGIPILVPAARAPASKLLRVPTARQPAARRQQLRSA
jgi:hypothetical protein